MFLSIVLTVIPLITWLLIAASINVLDGSRFQVRGIVAPFFASVAIMFALFASLLASEVWQRASAIKSELTKEVSALRSLHRLAKALELPGDIVEAKLALYVNSIVMQQVAVAKRDALQERTYSERSSAALDELFNFGVAGNNFRNNGSANTLYLNELTKVRDARLQRIALEQDHAQPVKIGALLLFGFLTQLAIGLVHCGNIRACYWSIGLFSLAFSLSVALIIQLDQPIGASHLIMFDYASKLWMMPK